MILAKSIDRGRDAVSKSKTSLGIELKKAGVLPDRDTEISTMIPATKEQQKMIDGMTHAAKQINTPQTNTQKKRKNMSDR